MSPYLLMSVVAWLNDRTLSSCASTVSSHLHLRMALGGVGAHLGDPARLVRRGEGRGDDGEAAVLADLLGHRVHHRLGDAVERRLVDEPFARVGRRVGVVADDMDALRQRLLQHRRDRDRIVGGEQDAVDAAGDVVVDELDLLVDLGLGRPVGLRLDVAELLGGVLDALGGGVEVADADQLRHVDDGDLLAGLVRRIGRLAAVVFHWRGGRGGAGSAGERARRQIVAAVPLAGGVRAGRHMRTSANAAAAVVRRYLDFIVASFPASPPTSRLTSVILLIPPALQRACDEHRRE